MIKVVVLCKRHAKGRMVGVGCCCVSGCAGVCNARLVGWGLPARRCLEPCFLTRVGPATSADTSRRVCVARAALIDKRRPSRHRHCNHWTGVEAMPFALPPWTSRRSTRSRPPWRPRRRPSRPATSRRRIRSTCPTTSEHSARRVGGAT
jgi:hypothetical protein